MNKSKLTGLVVLTIMSLALSYKIFYKEIHPQRTKPIWADSKQYPYEDYFLQMAYPDEYPNIDEKERVLHQIKQAEIYRDAPDGFDEEWITQGPGNIGARINTIAVHPDNEAIMYAGFSDGGVFKTTDEGANWKPVFDEQTSLTVGDIVLDPVDPNIVYVGTGDLNISGFPAIGDGLYRSKDAGETWEYLGLKEQRIISKIVIDPIHHNNIFVATMGLPFVRNSDRGVYRSTDGGQSWEQVLLISEQTGVIDLLINPQNPQVLYAAGWDRIRNNKESMVRGEGARIFKTSDGGDHWEMLEGGLPNMKHTRIGLAMSGTNPDVVFALYVDNHLNPPCDNSGYNVQNIYKTVDAGMHWDTIPTSFVNNGLSCDALGGFGWYFGQLRVNPKDDNDLFILGVDLWRSLDGGQNWFTATPPWHEYQVHADKHDLVFTKNDNIVLATDGGLYKADPNNDNWRDLENIVATQFYRVAYNPNYPDFYYGGAQDNGTTGGNYNNINSWTRIFGSDGFQAVFHPTDPNKYYVETQNGGIFVTTDGFSFRSGTNGIDQADAQSWDMPYLMSSHDSDVLYAGTDRVYRSISDTIPYWLAISENLTNPENDYRDHNISALSESPINAALLYAATSDAQLWRTDDDGTNWIAINDGLPVRYVSDVMASPSFEDVVFVTHSGYKDNDDTPLIHRSTDRGSSWESIVGDLPPIAINELLVLPEREDSIIFVATDAGVYATQNGGTNWNRLGNNMPLIPVFDLTWNEEKNELVAATFARGILSYPLDSLKLEAVDTPTKDHFLQQVEINLAPNPTPDGIWLTMKNISNNKKTFISILDIHGKLLQTKPWKSIPQYVDLSAYAKGIYIVRIEQGQAHVSRRLVKF